MNETSGIFTEPFAIMILGLVWKETEPPEYFCIEFRVASPYSYQWDTDWWQYRAE